MSKVSKRSNEQERINQTMEGFWCSRESVLLQLTTLKQSNVTTFVRYIKFSRQNAYTFFIHKCTLSAYDFLLALAVILPIFVKKYYHFSIYKKRRTV